MFVEFIPPLPLVVELSRSIRPAVTSSNDCLDSLLSGFEWLHVDGGHRLAGSSVVVKSRDMLLFADIKKLSRSISRVD